MFSVSIAPSGSKEPDSLLHTRPPGLHLRRIIAPSPGDGVSPRVDIPSPRPHNSLLRLSPHCAQVAELADALASGASSRKGVEVRVLSWAPILPPSSARARM